MPSLKELGSDLESDLSCGEALRTRVAGFFSPDRHWAESQWSIEVWNHSSEVMKNTTAKSNYQWSEFLHRFIEEDTRQLSVSYSDSVDRFYFMKNSRSIGEHEMKAIGLVYSFFLLIEVPNRTSRMAYSLSVKHCRGGMNTFGLLMPTLTS